LGLKLLHMVEGEHKHECIVERPTPGSVYTATYIRRIWNTFSLWVKEQISPSSAFDSRFKMHRLYTHFTYVERGYADGQNLHAL